MADDKDNNVEQLPKGKMTPEKLLQDVESKAKEETVKKIRNDLQKVVEEKNLAKIVYLNAKKKVKETIASKEQELKDLEFDI